MSTTIINLQISQPDPLDIAKITPFFPTETQGDPGETPMLRMLAQALQWKYVSEGNGAYQTLFNFDDLELPISQITALQTALDAKATQATTDTKTEVDNKIAAAIANLINSAPGALDTLNELATSLGNDPNFATTVTNSLAGKVSLSGSYSKPAWLTQVAASIVEQSASYRFVTDTEKNTWNGKQDALTNPVTGIGTNNYLTKWSNGQIVDSSILDTGSSISYYQSTVRQIGSNPVFSVEALSGSATFHMKGTNSVLLAGMVAEYVSGKIKIGAFSSNGYYPVFYSNNVEVARFLTNGRFLLKTTTDAGYDFDVNGTARATKFYVSALNTAPSSASDTGTAGEIRFTSNAIYICTATNTWKKADIATW